MLCVMKGEMIIEYLFDRSEFLQFKNIRCVYRLTCVANGMSYIGQTNNLWRRLREHSNDLRKGEHSNKSLQKDYDNFGAEQFVFSIESKCEECESLDIAEREFIEKYREDGKCYNVFSGGLTGYSANSEFRDKMSKAHKGRKVSEKTRELKRQAAKRQWQNKEYRERMIESAKHQWEDDEYRNMMIAMHTGSANACGHKLSESDVLSARKEHSLGATIRELADKYKVSYPAMQQALSGRTWKNI